MKLVEILHLGLAVFDEEGLNFGAFAVFQPLFGSEFRPLIDFCWL